MQNQPTFGFGATGVQPTAAPASGGLFGTQPATPAFGAGTGLFGGTTTSVAPSLFGNTASTGFGAPPNAGIGGFGATPGAAPQTAPAFGVQQSTTPALGGIATPTPAFGAAATPAFGATAAPTFGATAAPTFGATAAPTFGATATPTLGATTTALPSFGAAATAASSFRPTAQVSAAAAPAPLFGATSTAAPTFGAAPTATPSFGLTTSAAPTFGAIATAAPTFGAATTTAPTFGLGGTTAPAFGAATTTAPSLGFGTGITTTSTSLNTSLGFNLGATTTSTVATTSSTTTTPSVGLGGLATTQAKVVTAQKDVTPKDQPLPNELLQTVEAFKGFVKQQKVYSSDISKCSARDFKKVEQDIKQLTALLKNVEHQLQINRQLAENLKYDTAKCLQDVEIAQRTQDTPPGLQYENTEPLKFFLNLADKFEKDMQALKSQIEGAESYVKNHRNPNPVTSQDMALGMRRLHESFVALAGRLHSVHSQVESQKEAYLQMRKQLYNDNTNPFDSHEGNLSHIFNYPLPKIATGPTPFSNLSLGATSLFAGQQNQSTMSFSTPTTAAPGFSNMTFGTSFVSQLGGNSSQLFAAPSLGQSTNSFQLQKPPTGNKRGKQ
ncbi:nuclear pore complex protein Nup58 isoform X1 [Diabrotica virgifera virgifera]|uniref:Nucleoporin Nup58 n=1 Tax=Diabrotica virgifera virgifera TaxID=50390 RepID=A0ABM5IEQ0_DIAVI|nr:nuclear pore complex protein Nup58 isoform X1 [Diabrotica virgifera virgifera]